VALTLIHEFRWFFDIALIIILLWLADRLLGVNPAKFLDKLVREFIRLIALQVTAGSLNAASLVLIAFFGFIIVLDPTGIIVDAIREHLARPKGAEFAASVDPMSVFELLVGFAAFSVFVAAWRERHDD
jgi:hypothetical protein